ncbi:sensor histidine kinase [Novosphingobium sp. PhB57]|uniref:sensor histidine kinase n=1 Tax=Novosphingobium sp. PhB57 TaxID=2485107 RepID=UPI001042D45F|nr:sensor histidine kinase [Novosphingobium sp. PhB57]
MDTSPPAGDHNRGTSALPEHSGFDSSPAAANACDGSSTDELQHRTRNMLAIMRSVFARTVEKGASLEDVAAHYQGRFDTIAPFLVEPAVGDRHGYDLETLISDELLRYPVRGEGNVKISGPSERLPHGIAQPIALALHELVTNAVKFGALETPCQGRLAIDWRRDKGDLVLRWRETGVPIVRSAPLPFGFGREFIEQGLPYQIGAETSFTIEPGGVVCLIRIPTVNRAATSTTEGVQP